MYWLEATYHGRQDLDLAGQGAAPALCGNAGSDALTVTGLPPRCRAAWRLCQCRHAAARRPRRLQSLAGAPWGPGWSLRFDNPALLALSTVRAAVQGAFDVVIAQMSTWEPDSGISRYNRAAPGSVHRSPGVRSGAGLCAPLGARPAMAPSTRRSARWSACGVSAREAQAPVARPCRTLADGAVSRRLAAPGLRRRRHRPSCKPGGCMLDLSALPRASRSTSASRAARPGAARFSAGSRR